MDVTIAIVSYNTYNYLSKCINSVIQNTNVSYEIIVVDNNSNDGSKEYLKKIEKEIPGLKVIFNKNNVGFARANNQALRIAKGKYFVLLNSDAFVKKAALDELFFFMEKTTDCAVCGPQLYYPDGKFQKSYSPIKKPPTILSSILLFKNFSSFYKDNQTTKGNCNYEIKENIIVGRPRGVCFFVRRKAISSVGPLDERFFMYDEEIDWAKRFIDNGWNNYIVPSSKVIHVWGGSSNNISLLKRIQDQSDIMFFRKHYGYLGEFKMRIRLFFLSINYFCYFMCNYFLLKHQKKILTEAKRYFKSAFQIKKINPKN